MLLHLYTKYRKVSAIHTVNTKEVCAIHMHGCWHALDKL